MQWNCPHCGVGLAISTGTLGTGWSFSKCFQCGGFALIRKAEINIIKVDKAPPGERIILPESTTGKTPSSSLLQSTQDFSKHELNSLLLSNPPPFRSQSAAEKVSPEIKNGTEAKKPSKSKANQQSDSPLSQTGSSKTGLKRFGRLIPAGITFFSLVAIGSVTYLTYFGSSSVPPAGVPAVAKTEATKTEATGTSQITLTTTAAAPQRSSFSQTSYLFVQTRAQDVPVHAGPGMEYPVRENAHSNTRYLVSDFDDRWLKINVQNGTLLTFLGWVRNDQVRVISEPDDSRVATPDLNPLR